MKKIVCLLSLLAVGNVCMLSAQEKLSKEYALWYNRPAFNRGADFNQLSSKVFPYDEDWEKWSLPIGNGYMGANIFGRTDTERIQLSEKTLGNRGCYDQGGFTSFAEIYLDFYQPYAKDYRRKLCLNNALATVDYEYEGVRYSREYLANYPNNVIAVKIKADVPQSVSFTVRPVIPYLNPDRVGDGRTGRVHASEDLIVFSGEMEYYALPYEGQIKVLNYGGKKVVSNDDEGDNGRIAISKADSVVLFITAGTSYQLNEKVFLNEPQEKFKGNEHPHRMVSERMTKAVSKGYEVLKQEHISDYQSYFNRVDFSLMEKTPDIPTDQLVYNYRKGKRDAYLEELLFQYGRYLLIASSRQGALPPNLMGGWTQYDYSPWSGGYWHNINIQMNYWPVFNTNLAELFEPFVAYNEAYRKQAEFYATSFVQKHNPQMLGKTDHDNGWGVGTHATAFMITEPGSRKHSGPGVGGLTTKMFWDYYDFTRDRSLLEEHVYPALEGMAKFLSKTVKPDKAGIYLVSPSASPENRHNRVHHQTVGCTFDQGMVWESFNDLLNAASVLKKKSSFLREIKSLITKLDPVQIGASGQLKEYREEDKYGDIGDPNHRHISHLCPLYPGVLINSNHPDWMKASEVALKFRANTGGTIGWPMAHRLCCWARLKDGSQCFDYYERILKEGVFENLWGKCPPFMFDGNLGATAGVAEMLLQSHEGYIEPLAALPSEWNEGRYRGLVARGNFVISVGWQNSKMYNMEIHSRNGGLCKVQYPFSDEPNIVDAQGNRIKYKRLAENRIEFKTKKGEHYFLSM